MIHFLRKIFFAGLLLGSHLAIANEDFSDLFSASGQPTTTSEFLSQVRAGSIVVIGEQHDIVAHHDRQMLLLYLLKSLGHKIHVGLEFFRYPYQNKVNEWLRGTLSESLFLSEIQWGRDNFNLYRQQALFPLSAGGWTLALNAPSELTRKIARQGLESLTPEERELMPPAFELGNELYLERFREIMGGHGSGMDEEMLQRMFAAQSTWDDTMAWKAVDYMVDKPNDILVIIVGDFHVAFGGGLPDRIQQRGHHNLIYLSQINVPQNLSPDEKKAITSPHLRYGERAHFTWLSQEPEDINNE